MHLSVLKRAGTCFLWEKTTGLMRSKVFLSMKLTILIMLIACMQAGAVGYGQAITLSGKNMPLKKVFTEIKKQSGYSFFYSDKDLAKANRVNINVQNTPLVQVLNQVFTNQPLVFSIIENTVVVKEKLVPVDQTRVTRHLFQLKQILKWKNYLLSCHKNLPKIFAESPYGVLKSKQGLLKKTLARIVGLVLLSLS